jgi:hypothetical protein
MAFMDIRLCLIDLSSGYVEDDKGKELIEE